MDSLHNGTQKSLESMDAFGGGSSPERERASHQASEDEGTQQPSDEVLVMAQRIAARTHRSAENIATEIASLEKALDQAREQGDVEVARLAETGILAYTAALAIVENNDK